MIKAYFVGISTHYEGEDIEVRYSIYEDQELVCKKSVLREYEKPAIVNQVALVALLKELEKYMDQEIVVIMNDAALNEQIRGTSQTKNKDVLKMLRFTKERISKFNNSITIKDVSNDKVELAKWNEVLKP
ncbi:MAG: hypothetical protein JJT76_11525 [Clostridiaceae bacterium]|nr:hypothetical protein [Clostridiaceae bacterium]